MSVSEKKAESLNTTRKAFQEALYGLTFFLLLKVVSASQSHQVGREFHNKLLKD